MSKEVEDEGGVRIATAPYRNVRNEEKGRRVLVSDMWREEKGRDFAESIGGEEEGGKEIGNCKIYNINWSLLL